MLRLSRRPRRKSAPSGPRFARLGLERLETRDCPSYLTLSVSYGNQGNALISGRVTDTPPAR